MPRSASKPVQAIAAARVFDGEAWHPQTIVSIEGGVITACDPAMLHRSTDRFDEFAEGAILAPGFVDLQVNGGGGVLLNDATSAEAIAAIAAAHRPFGTTSLLPTLITDRPDSMARITSLAADALRAPGVAGFHFEGPWLAPARRGIHPGAWIRPPSDADQAYMEAMARLGPFLVTLAPEHVPAALVARLASLGARIAVGHSEADAATLLCAIEAGLSGATHLWNAMSPISGRAPGVVGTVLDQPGVLASLIVDGIHVDPALLRLAFAAKGADRLALVTDAMPTVGTDDDGFTLCGIRIDRRGDRLTGPGGTLAGAHLDMITAIQRAVALMGVELGQALAMASRVPAAFLGLRKGRIRPGWDADLVAFDPATFRVLATWIGGERKDHS